MTTPKSPGPPVAFPGNADAEMTRQLERQLLMKSAAIESSIIAMAMAGIDNRLFYVNQAFVDLWQLPDATAAVHRSPLEFWVNPDEAQKVVEILLNLGHWQGEMLARRFDGSTMNLQLSANLVRDENNEPLCMMASFLDTTGRTQLEQQTRLSEKRLNEAQRIAKVGSWELDLRKNELFWTDEIFNLFEIDKTKFGATYEAFLNAIHPEDRDAVNKAYGSSLHSRTPYAITHRLLMQDGRIKWVEERCATDFDADGKALISRGTVQDITEQHEAAAILRISEERLRLALTAGSVGLYDLNVQTGEAQTNAEYAEMLGHDPGEFRETNAAWIARMHPEDAAHVAQVYRDYIAGRLPEYRVEFRQRTKSGQWRWILSHGKLVEHDANGRPLRMLGTHTDITKLKEAEERLKGLNDELEWRVTERTRLLAESERQLRHAQQMAHIGHWWSNEQTRELYWSEEIYRIFGQEPQQFVPTVDAFYALVHPEDLQFVHRMVDNAFAKGGVYNVDHRIVLPDGTVRWVHEEALVERDAAGNPLRLTGTVQDITERKMTEATLIRSREDAERANAAKSEFLSRMSHELRTPLNAILGFSQLLQTDRKQPLTGEQLENLDEIMHAGKHLLQLVDEVLDLARVESGQLQVNSETVAIKPLIDACLSQLKPLASEHYINMLQNVPAHYTVHADPLLVKQVLINLISNAIKYNKVGGEILIGCSKDDSQYLRISIRDTGNGIPAEQLPRLFKPFERLESAYMGIQGAGIGLSLAKRLVDAMQGEIGVSSAPGAGSTFWFELPARASGAFATELPPASPRSLLYVEDNPANLHLMRRILEKRKDLRMIEAPSGELALELASRERPELILLDISLLGIDGFETLRRLRLDPLTKDIPVIAVSANAMQGDIKKGMAKGFDDYLTKPFNISSLFLVLDRYLPKPD